MTRSDYLEASHKEQGAAHRRYFRQFVTPFAMQQASLILERHKDALFGPDQLPQIPLGAWVGHQRMHPAQVYHALSVAGDFMTTVTSVCILKEAARQLLEQPSRTTHLNFHPKNAIIKKIAEAVLYSDVTVFNENTNNNTDMHKNIQIKHESGSTDRERADDIDNFVADMQSHNKEKSNAIKKHKEALTNVLAYCSTDDEFDDLFNQIEKIWQAAIVRNTADRVDSYISEKLAKGEERAEWEKDWTLD